MPLSDSWRLTIFAYTNMKTALASRADRLFRAFSDRTRLRILHLLRGGELCVCDIVDVLRVPQPKASRHLAYLRRAGVVIARKEGLWSYYRLAQPRNGLHAKLIGCLDSCCEDMPELARDDARFGRRSPGSCCK